MKSPDAIKKGLATCSADECHGQHTDCPYHPELMCIRNICGDALALIQQLESDKQQLEGMLTHMNQLRDAAAGRALKMEERVHQLEAERDAAVACIPRVCKYCKHDGPLNAWGESECELGPVSTIECFNGNTHWRWRGVQKEE